MDRLMARPLLVTNGTESCRWAIELPAYGSGTGVLYSRQHVPIVITDRHIFCLPI